MNTLNPDLGVLAGLASSRPGDGSDTLSGMPRSGVLLVCRREIDLVRVASAACPGIRAV
ncbi:MAG: hypothetical protein ABWZ98_00050 [Nakamurella sp.]